MVDLFVFAFAQLSRFPDAKRGARFRWEGREHRIRLGTWKLARRCVFIRRPNVTRPAAIPPERAQLPAPDGAKPAPAKGPRQLEFDFAKDRKGREWDCCILVTNEEKLDLTALSQLYRDRGGCENNFDEFKNQWGWSGFTTKRLKPNHGPIPALIPA